MKYLVTRDLHKGIAKINAWIKKRVLVLNDYHVKLSMDINGSFIIILNYELKGEQI